MYLIRTNVDLTFVLLSGVYDLFQLFCVQYYTRIIIFVLYEVFISPPHLIFQGCVRCGTYRALYTTGITGTGRLGRFDTIYIPIPPVPVQTFIPIPCTSVFSVQHQYRHGTLRHVRYNINTGTSGTGMDVCTGEGTCIGTTSIPVLDTSVTFKFFTMSTRYRTHRSDRFDSNPVSSRCDIKLGFTLMFLHFNFINPSVCLRSAKRFVFIVTCNE